MKNVDYSRQIYIECTAFPKYTYTYTGDSNAHEHDSIFVRAHDA